jgi:hypothetical protein
METGLFEIQASHLNGFRQAHQINTVSREVVRALFGRADPAGFHPRSHGITNETEAETNPGSKPAESAVEANAELAHCFLRLANLPNFALDRLSRYEATLWRQVGRILFALDALDRRKPQERRRRFRVGGLQELPADGRDDS